MPDHSLADSTAIEQWLMQHPGIAAGLFLAAVCLALVATIVDLQHLISKGDD